MTSKPFPGGTMALALAMATGLAAAPAASAGVRTLARRVVLGQTAQNETFSQLQQAVAALPGGIFGTVWVEGAYPAWTVRMQWVDAFGQALLAPGGLLVAGGSGVANDTVIVAHPSAGAYVAYVQADSVVVQRFDGVGQPLWPGGGLVAAGKSPSHYQYAPHLVPDDDGVFACFGTSGASSDIVCQSLSEAGIRQWGANGASVGHGPDLEILAPPRGVADGAGGLLVFWRNQRDPFQPSPPPMRMEGQRFDVAGNRVWGTSPLVVRNTNLASDNGYSYTFFQVVSDGNGGAVLAFNDWTGTSDLALDVMAQRVSGEGDLLWGEGAVVTGANGHQQHEQTFPGPDGGAFVAVWETVDGFHNRLRLFRLGPGGLHLWAPEGLLLSDPAATAYDYAVFGSFDGGLLRLAWTHQLFPASYEMDVHLAGYSPDGARIGGTGGVRVTGAPDAQFLRGLAFSAEAQALLAVWEDRAKGWNDEDTKGAVVPDAFWRWNRAFTR